MTRSPSWSASACTNRFRARISSSRLYDALDETISFPYEIATGKRQHTAPISANSGSDRDCDQDAQATSDPDPGRGGRAWARSRSVLRPGPGSGCPIVAGGEVIGVLAMESGDANAFDEGDQQLLTALASTTGVALRNARLFAETTQRNAELARHQRDRRGSRQAARLSVDRGSIGDRTAQIFRGNSMVIGFLDAGTQLFPFRTGSTQVGEKASLPFHLELECHQSSSGRGDRSESALCPSRRHLAR